MAKLRFNAGSYNLALESAYRAALMNGELQSKVNVFSLIAKIQLVLGDADSAKNHTILACSIRKHFNWKFNQEINQLASRFGIDDNLPLPAVALKVCEKEWLGYSKKWADERHEVKVDENRIVEEGKQGTITSIIENRPFTFIRRADNGQNVYARISEIPENLRYSGAELEFDLAESFDKLKNKKSVQAVRIRAIQDEKIA